MREEVQTTLHEIHELGYVHICDGRVVASVPPTACDCMYRWEPTLQYLNLGTHELCGEYFVSVCDGWREHSKPCWPSNVPPEFMPWNHPKVKKHHYIVDGRFRHSVMAPDGVYPELVLPVLTYNKHIMDRTAICIPYVDLKSVEIADSAWESKKDVAFWRGSHVVGDGEYSYLGVGGKHPREWLVAKSGVDAAFGDVPMDVALQNKYLFDVDGTVSDGNGLYWKLLSNSVVLKHRSHWQNWYSSRLRAWKHYVPIDDFRNLDDILRWCRMHDDECKEIARNATEFARREFL